MLPDSLFVTGQPLEFPAVPPFPSPLQTRCRGVPLLSSGAVKFKTRLTEPPPTATPASLTCANMGDLKDSTSPGEGLAAPDPIMKFEPELRALGSHILWRCQPATGRVPFQALYQAGAELFISRDLAGENGSNAAEWARTGIGLDLRSRGVQKHTEQGKL
ncbi:hypothetical protein SKAU_G00335700 [Synaphobranchus kaupii]|uniref:Uncharacterized protein n=1 Tax=Synaphobranchus kaupii TaxID=118154 RepID=A0A9Q1IJ08_SYNKA|nr:hypothetical protein SKAU_G00335700 [Synaphobranchus kaupii]